MILWQTNGKAFGFDVIEINGHDFNELNDAIEKANAAVERPVVIIAHTLKVRVLILWKMKQNGITVVLIQL